MNNTLGPRNPQEKPSYTESVDRLRGILTDDAKQEIDSLFLHAQIDPEVKDRSEEEWITEAEDAISRMRNPDGTEMDLRRSILKLFVAHRMAEVAFANKNLPNISTEFID